MKFKIVIIILLFLSSSIFSQFTVTGKVVNMENRPVNSVQVFDENGGLLSQTDILGKFSFITGKNEIPLIFYVEKYRLKKVFLKLKDFKNLKVELEFFFQELSEIQIKLRREKIFELKHLKDVEGTAIYAGKKTEVILVNQSTANLATNNARQIFNQIAGLNIYQNDDAGLQLNIGGRGLDPNRTANFNTRQNGYDISADVLGYPESYYTPASEGLQEI